MAFQREPQNMEELYEMISKGNFPEVAPIWYLETKGVQAWKDLNLFFIASPFAPRDQ